MVIFSPLINDEWSKLCTVRDVLFMQWFTQQQKQVTKVRFGPLPLEVNPPISASPEMYWCGTQVFIHAMSRHLAEKAAEESARWARLGLLSLCSGHRYIGFSCDGGRGAQRESMMIMTRTSYQTLWTLSYSNFLNPWAPVKQWTKHIQINLSFFKPWIR
jgi:hypothetical protein